MSGTSDRLARGRIKLFQSSDAYGYFDMLMATSRTARAFCRNAGVEYEAFIGVRRGWQNWHASYNRIPYLHDLLMEGYEGWVLHMDADAYVQDLNFDLRGYLADKDRYLLIAAPSGASDHFWDFNNGVALFNLGHPLAKELVRAWYGFLSRYDLWADATAWHEAVSDDQAMLHWILSQRPTWRPAILTESWDFMNSGHASFVRQHLLSWGFSPEERLQGIRKAVAAVMGDAA